VQKKLPPPPQKKHHIPFPETPIIEHTQPVLLFDFLARPNDAVFLFYQFNALCIPAIMKQQQCTYTFLPTYWLWLVKCLDWRVENA